MRCVLALRRQAEGDGEHDAAAGQKSRVVGGVVATRVVGGSDRVEGICVGGSVGRDLWGDERASGTDGGLVMRVGEVVEAQPDLGLVETLETRACMNGVVEIDVGDGERIDA